MSDLTLSNSLAHLAARINAEHEQVKAAIRDGLAHAIAAGSLLLEAKAKVEHGDWLAWVQGQCEISERTAQAYMRAAREFPKLSPVNAQRVADMSFRQAMAVMGAGSRFGQKIAAIDAAAKAEPQRFGRLLDNAERTGRVDAPFKRLVVLRHAEAIRAEPPPLPGGRSRVVAIDPPWQHGLRTDNAPPYPPMTIEEIKAMPVADLAEKDALLWLWTPNLQLGEGIARAVLDAWGFAPKAILTWVKTDHLGTGSWLRNVTEHCFFAARGNPVHTLNNETTALFAPAGAHSEKPDEFYRLVESLCPAPRYLELFARKTRPGWEVWGDQVPRLAAE